MFLTAQRPTFTNRAFALDRGFERFVNAALQGDSRGRVTQDETSWTITLDVPGVARDALEIGVEGNVVRIATKADAPRKYNAAYELPQDVDTSVSEATLVDGVLTLKLGKQVPVSKVTQIAIK